MLYARGKSIFTYTGEDEVYPIPPLTIESEDKLPPTPTVDVIEAPEPTSEAILILGGVL